MSIGPVPVPQPQPLTTSAPDIQPLTSSWLDDPGSSKADESLTHTRWHKLLESDLLHIQITLKGDLKEGTVSVSKTYYPFFTLICEGAILTRFSCLCNIDSPNCTALCFLATSEHGVEASWHDTDGLVRPQPPHKEAPGTEAWCRKMQTIWQGGDATPTWGRGSAAGSLVMAVTSLSWPSECHLIPTLKKPF